MTTMDLNKLNVFVRVVEARGFTAAARVLEVPKSSVSRAVTQLEETLGVRLLQRTTRTLALTEAGLALYDRASRALTELGDAAASAAEMDGAPHGTVRITAPADIGNTLLAELVVDFCREHPAIRVEVSLTGRVVDLVEEGFDLALRAGRLADSSLIARKLAIVEGAIFATPKYLKKHGTPARVADLAAHSCVVFRPQQGRATWSLRGPRGEETVSVGGQIAADDFSFVRRAVLSSAGLGVIPSFLFTHELETGKVVRVLPTYAAMGAALHLVHPSARHLPQRVQLLRDYLLEKLGGATLTPEGCKKRGRSGEGAALGDTHRPSNRARRSSRSSSRTGHRPAGMLAPHTRRVSTTGRCSSRESLHNCLRCPRTSAFHPENRSRSPQRGGRRTRRTSSKNQ